MKESLLWRKPAVASDQIQTELCKTWVAIIQSVTDLVLTRKSDEITGLFRSLESMRVNGKTPAEQLSFFGPAMVALTERCPDEIARHGRWVAQQIDVLCGALLRAPTIQPPIARVVVDESTGLPRETLSALSALRHYMSELVEELRDGFTRAAEQALHSDALCRGKQIAWYSGSTGPEALHRDFRELQRSFSAAIQGLELLPDKLVASTPSQKTVRRMCTDALSLHFLCATKLDEIRQNVPSSGALSESLNGTIVDTKDFLQKVDGAIRFLRKQVPENPLVWTMEVSTRSSEPEIFERLADLASARRRDVKDPSIERDGFTYSEYTAEKIRNIIDSGGRVIAFCERKNSSTPHGGIQGFLIYYPKDFLPPIVQSRVNRQYPVARGGVLYGDLLCLAPEVEDRAAHKLLMNRMIFSSDHADFFLGESAYRNFSGLGAMLYNNAVVNVMDLSWTDQGTVPWIGFIIPISSTLRAETLGQIGEGTMPRDSVVMKGLKHNAQLAGEPLTMFAHG